MGVRLADIIGVLDAAYPPALAESWDSVGLVCGDPDQQIDTVTVAVDATAAVVDEMEGPGAHLLLAHHPLLLRGVDTVAASTPKERAGSSPHPCGRRAVHRAYQRGLG